MSDLDALTAIGIHKEARRLALEDARDACQRQIEVFLSPEYAIGQPTSSMQERFGVAACIEAIEKLIEDAG